MEFKVIENKRPEGAEICDFCSSPKVEWVYPANDGIADVAQREDGGILVQESKGNWAACEYCSEFIERNMRKHLLKQSANSFVKEYGEIIPRELIENGIKKIHDLFFEVRTGERKPYGSHN
jgi:hypothetical protein